jgi:hypothetical protein
VKLVLTSLVFFQVLIGADSAEQKQWFRKHVKNCSLRIKNFREALLSRNKPVLQANPRQPDSLVKPKCSKCKKEFMTKFQLAKHSEKCRYKNARDIIC